MTPVLVALPAAVVTVAVLVRRARTSPGHSNGARTRTWARLWLLARARRWRPGPTPSVAGDLHRLHAALVGGASLRGSLEWVARGDGAWSVVLSDVVNRAQAGWRLDEALDAWAVDSADPTVVLLVDSLVIVGRTGGSHARAVGAVMETVHDEEARQREVRALTSQARASALVLMATPIGFAALLASVDSRIRTFFVGSWLGLGCALLGLALDAAGGWWMRRAVARVR